MKKIITLFLSLMMLFSITAGIDFSVYADDYDDYIEIWNIEDLDNINSAMDKKYKLMADIDMTVDTAEGGAYNNNGWGWKPIGYNNLMTAYTEFTGEFDGNGHSIIGLNINIQNFNPQKGLCVGLFAVNSGKVANLHIINANIYCAFSGDVSNYSYIGSLCGENYNEISNCSFDGIMEIKCTDYAYYYNYTLYRYCNSRCAGIAGKNNTNGIILSCYNIGKIKMNCSHGEITSTLSGIAYCNGGKIKDCYNCGNLLDSKDNVAGYAISSYNCECCYNAGGAKFPVGSSDSNTNIYAIKGTGEQYYPSNTILLNEIQSTMQSMYKGFDFENVWIIDPDSDYPYPQLRSNRQSESTEAPPEEPSIDLDNFKIKTVSLSLESSITMNYKVLKTAVADFENPYIEFTRNGKTTTITDYTEQGDYYVFSYRDIAPQAMNDTVQAVLYATYNDVLYNSKPVDYSVSAYAYAMLEKCSSNQYARLRTLLVDLLNYGAAAQIYQNYKTDDLVNADLTDTQKSWASSQELNLMNVTDKACDIVENPAVEWKAVGLQLNDSVAVRYKFAAEDVNDIQLKVTCGKSEWMYGAESFADNGDGTYTFIFNALNADKMQKDIYITAMNGDTAVSNTMRYSVESYAKQIQDSMPNSSLRKLTDAMMRYGISASNYI